MRFMTTLLLVCLAAQPSVAQDNGHPAKLSGFLKSGMCLGVRSFDDTNGIKITVYSVKDFEIAVDARTLELDELADKYPSVKRLRDRRLDELVASLDAKRDELPPNTKFGEPKIGLTVDQRELLCKVEHVGDDYILVRFGTGLKSGRVIATSFISTIRWRDIDEWNFATSVPQVTTTPGRTKP